MKPETRFRKNKVDPFLKTLENTWSESIQQVAIRGTPDKLLCVAGRFVALELKAENGATSALQDLKLKAIKDSGGVALVASPDNWEEVKEILTKLSKGYYVHSNVQTTSKPKPNGRDAENHTSRPPRKKSVRASKTDSKTGVGYQASNEGISDRSAASLPKRGGVFRGV